MNKTQVIHWIYHTPAIEALRRADHHVIEIVEVVHVLGLLLLLTGVVLINLRLFGFGLRRQSLSAVRTSVSPMVWTGLGLAVASGLIIFLSAATKYDVNSAFWPKMTLLALAVIVQATLLKKVTANDAPHPVLAKATATLSLALWFGVGLAGRAIGFVA